MSCLQALPASLEVQIGKESSGVAVCVWPLPRCACEGGNREEARMVGLLHVHENSREWETGKPLGAIWGLLVFRVQGKGNSSPAKDTPWLVLKALT